MTDAKPALSRSWLDVLLDHLNELGGPEHLADHTNKVVSLAEGLTAAMAADMQSARAYAMFRRTQPWLAEILAGVLELTAGGVVPYLHCGLTQANLLSVAGRHDDAQRLIDQLKLAYGRGIDWAHAAFLIRRRAAGKSDDLSTHFCTEPFIRAEMLMDGTVSPCCSLWTTGRFGNVFRDDLKTLWHGAEAEKVRDGIRDGSFRYCHKDRCRMFVYDNLPLRADLSVQAMTVPEVPPHLFLAHDETCNLACPSCRSGIEAASVEKRKRLEDVLDRVISPAVSSGKLRTISLSGQGDPWSSPHYRAVLAQLAAENCPPVEIHLNTNAALMTEARWAQYAGLSQHRVEVRVSVDACTALTYSKLRPPAPWAGVLENLKFIGRLRKEEKIDLYYLSITVQADNYIEMAEQMRFAKEIGCDQIVYAMIQHTGSHLNGIYDEKNVADPRHPEYEAFLEVLRDPFLNDPFALMFDVKAIYEHARATLPSDDPLATQVRRRKASDSANDWAAEGFMLLAMGQPWRAAQRFERATQREDGARYQAALAHALAQAAFPLAKTSP